MELKCQHLHVSAFQVRLVCAQGVGPACVSLPGTKRLVGQSAPSVSRQGGLSGARARGHGVGSDGMRR